MILRIGTRKSKLALVQTQLVIAAIQKNFPHLECVIIPIITTGDRITDRNLYDIGGKALFLKELEQALLDKQIDIAVHSLKDMPGNLPPLLEIAAVLEREDPRDVFISYNYTSLMELPSKAIVGSSSVRRKLLMNKMRADLEFVMFRGNVDSRLNKVKNNEVTASILAAAGLRRLGLFNPAYCFPMSVTDMIPAVGQGVIAVEINSENILAKSICEKINHLETWKIIQVERSFMTYLDASCRTPLAAYAEYTNKTNFRSSFMLSDETSSKVRFHNASGHIDDAYDIGINTAKIMTSNQI